MIDMLGFVISVIISGQLIVAATEKATTYPSFEIRSGSRTVAAGIIFVDAMLSIWVLVAWPSAMLAFLAAGIFYSIGAIIRAYSVHKGEGADCLCSGSVKATTWSDVAANVVLAMAAFGLVFLQPQRPGWLAALGISAWVAYVALWGFAERSRSRIRRAVRAERVAESNP